MMDKHLNDLLIKLAQFGDPYLHYTHGLGWYCSITLQLNAGGSQVLSGKGTHAEPIDAAIELETLLKELVERLGEERRDDG